MLLDPSFYSRPTTQVARELLGKLLVSQVENERVSGIIVEVEAYLGKNDSASHSYSGPSRRNRSMFLAPGTLYVYTIHAKYCMNAVTQAYGIGEAVLIRAVEPVEGLATMQRRRGIQLIRDLARGPARLCQAMSVDRQFDGWNLCEQKTIWIEEWPTSSLIKSFSITRTPRIGISSGRDKMLRYFVDGNPFVSGLKRDHRRPASHSFFGNR